MGTDYNQVHLLFLGKTDDRTNGWTENHVVLQGNIGYELARHGLHAFPGFEKKTVIKFTEFLVSSVLQAIPKNGIWFKVKEEVKRQPEEYMKYFEDWLFTSDAEIGP
jgi:hypothetical protein